jgi:hypothetical protein
MLGSWNTGDTDIDIVLIYVYIHSLRRYTATLPGTARRTGGYAATPLRYLGRHEVPEATRLRRYATCDGGYGEMRDGNQTTFRENGFRMNGATEGPFDRGKVLKEPVRSQRPSGDRGPYHPSGMTTGMTTGRTCDHDRYGDDDHRP